MKLQHSFKNVNLFNNSKIKKSLMKHEWKFSMNAYIILQIKWDVIGLYIFSSTLILDLPYSLSSLLPEYRSLSQKLFLRRNSKCPISTSTSLPFFRVADYKWFPGPLEKNGCFGSWIPRPTIGLWSLPQFYWNMYASVKKGLVSEI